MCTFFKLELYTLVSYTWTIESVASVAVEIHYQSSCSTNTPDILSDKKNVLVYLKRASGCVHVRLSLALCIVISK